MSEGPALAIRDLTAGYGAVEVLHGITLALAAGEVLCLLGRNGAGKTTLLKTVMGLVRPTGGSILLGPAGAAEASPAVELQRLPAHEVPRHGVGYVPQGRRLFGELSVADNLRIGRMARARSAPEARADAGIDWILALFPILGERLGQPASVLSGGEQQMLAIARALCLEPRVLLMDEPTEGLMPSMIDSILETVDLLRGRGVAVILVEQKVEAALRVADRVTFLENGTIRGSATPAELHADPSALHRHIGLGEGGGPAAGGAR